MRVDGELQRALQTIRAHLQREKKAKRVVILESQKQIQNHNKKGLNLALEPDNKKKNKNNKKKQLF